MKTIEEQIGEALTKENGEMGLYDNLAKSHPSLERGQVWCKKCSNTQRG